MKLGFTVVNSNPVTASSSILNRDYRFRVSLVAAG